MKLPYINLYQFTILQKLLIVQWIQWKGVLLLLTHNTIYLHLFRFHIWAPDWLRCLTAACPELCLRSHFPSQADPSTKQLPIEGPSQTWKEKWRRTVRNLPQHLLEPRPLRTGLSSEGGARNPECLGPWLEKIGRNKKMAFKSLIETKNGDIHLVCTGF